MEWGDYINLSDLIGKETNAPIMHIPVPCTNISDAKYWAPVIPEIVQSEKLII